MTWNLPNGAGVVSPTDARLWHEVSNWTRHEIHAGLASGEPEQFGVPQFDGLPTAIQDSLLILVADALRVKTTWIGGFHLAEESAFSAMANALRRCVRDEIEYQQGTRWRDMVIASTNSQYFEPDDWNGRIDAIVGRVEWNCLSDVA